MAFRPAVVVCPTEFLDGLEKLLARESPPDRGLDARLAVFTPRQTLAILKHVAGSGPAKGFSLAVLVAPLESSCRVAIDSSTAPRVGQPWAMLLGSSQDDDIQGLDLEGPFLAAWGKHGTKPVKCGGNTIVKSRAEGPDFDVDER